MSPIYSYECQACKSKFEKLVRKMDETVECPDCGESLDIKKVWSVPAVAQWSCSKGSL